MTAFHFDTTGTVDKYPDNLDVLISEVSGFQMCVLYTNTNGTLDICADYQGVHISQCLLQGV